MLKKSIPVAALLWVFVVPAAAQTVQKTCLPSIQDAANPSSPIAASSIPTPGALLPLGPELFVAPTGEVGIGTILLLPCMAASAAPRASSVPRGTQSSDQDSRRDLESVKGEFREACKKWRELNDAGHRDEAGPHPVQAFVSRYRACAEAHPGTDAAAEAWLWVARASLREREAAVEMLLRDHVGSEHLAEWLIACIGWAGDTEEASRAMAILRSDYAGQEALVRGLVYLASEHEEFRAAATTELLRDHSESPHLAALGFGLGSSGSIHPETEAILRKLMNESPHASVRAHARYGLALHLYAVGEEAVLLQLRVDEKKLEEVRASIGEAALTRMLELDHSELTAEADRILDAAGDEEFDVPVYYGTTPLSEVIQKKREQLHRFGIGAVAQEIEADDLDGVPFKLSDYRGKVVMLDFWGHW